MSAYWALRSSNGTDIAVFTGIARSPAYALAIAADRACVLDRDAPADDGAASDRDLFAHRAQVREQHLLGDRRPAVEHHAAAHDAEITERERRQLLVARYRRVGGAHRPLAEARVVVE